MIMKYSKYTVSSVERHFTIIYLKLIDSKIKYIIYFISLYKLDISHEYLREKGIKIG